MYLLYPLSGREQITNIETNELSWVLRHVLKAKFLDVGCAANNRSHVTLPQRSNGPAANRSRFKFPTLCLIPCSACKIDNIGFYVRNEFDFQAFQVRKAFGEHRAQEIRNLVVDAMVERQKLKPRQVVRHGTNIGVVGLQNSFSGSICLT